MKVKKAPDPEVLLKRMAGLCAKSEQCTSDINTKLYKAGLPKEKRDEIIAYLTDNRYIDDARFARAFANYKVRFSGWGKRKICMALAAKRIPSVLITAAIDNIDDREYLKAASRVAEAKKRELDMNTSEDKAKFYRQMLQRGFESDIIQHLL